MRADNIIYWAARLGGNHVSMFLNSIPGSPLLKVNSVSPAFNIERNAWEERILVKVPKALLYRTSSMPPRGSEMHLGNLQP